MYTHRQRTITLTSEPEEERHQVVIILGKEHVSPLHVSRDEEEGLLVDAPGLSDQSLHGPVGGECVQVTRAQAGEEDGDQRPEVARPQEGKTCLEHQRGVIPDNVRHDLERSGVIV